VKIPRKSEADDEGEGAEGIDDVVDIEAVAGTLLVADAGECAIEGVAEPVEKDKEVDEPKGVGVLWGEGVGNAGKDLGEEGEDGEMVGIDEGWGVVGQPDKEAFFVGGGEGGVDALGVVKGLGLCHAAMMRDFGGVGHGLGLKRV